jgi:hypothetical protein
MTEHYSSDMFKVPFTVLRKTNAADGKGGFTVTEAQVGSTHFAHLRALRGNERTVAEGMSSVTEAMFVTWAAVDIRADDVLLYNGGRYNVRYINPPGLSQFQEIVAELGVVNG